MNFLDLSLDIICNNRLCFRFCSSKKHLFPIRKVFSRAVQIFARKIICCYLLALLYLNTVWFAFVFSLSCKLRPPLSLPVCVICVFSSCFQNLSSFFGYLNPFTTGEEVLTMDITEENLKTLSNYLLQTLDPNPDVRRPCKLPVFRQNFEGNSSFS